MPTLPACLAIVALVRHPFGPAFYDSTDLERQSEGTGGPNFDYWFEPKAVAWMHQGVPAGYYVSDTALANLTAANHPSERHLPGARPPRRQHHDTHHQGQPRPTPPGGPKRQTRFPQWRCCAPCRPCGHERDYWALRSATLPDLRDPTMPLG